MTACNVFPKVSGDCAYDSEWNCMYAGGLAGYSVVNASMENAMNITRLQYCIGITDIPHDYMVVDSFTDSGGYNNSVCTTSTTATYYYSGVNGLYSNGTNILEATCICACSTNVAVCYCVNTVSCCQYVCACAASSSRCGIACSCYTSGFSDSALTSFCYNLFYCIYVETTAASTCYSLGCFSFVNSVDNFGCTVCKTGGIGALTCCETRCYCFVRACACCYNFYCNGSCKCQITLTAFPTNTLCNFVNTGTCGSGTGFPRSYSCIFGICGLTQSKIQTIDTCFISPIKTVYLDYDKYGTGTVVYNVINAADNSCLCCNLVPKCYYTMSTCCCCLRYEIIQCSDAMSCIKSYAVSVGV